MRPVLIYPDAELEVTQFLRSLLDPVLVCTETPDPRPDAFVTVRRLGGGVDSRVTERPRVDIRCWAPTKKEAADLTRLTGAYIRGMRGRLTDPVVYRVVDVGGTQWLPDTESGHPRYAQAFELRFRGRPLEWPEM